MSPFKKERVDFISFFDLEPNNDDIVTCSTIWRQECLI